MLKLQTKVDLLPADVRISYDDTVTVLGSCFADNVGARMQHAGFDVLVNPFGTLYNPVSIAKSVERLDSGEPFTLGDCVEMGAGAGLVCSFSHHTSFARPSAGEFLAVANEALAVASDHWRRSGKAIITLGTVWCFRHLPDGEMVSNCLKRPSGEFQRERLSLDAASSILRRIVVGHPDKEFVFTVSPIRHLADGAHANTLSKSTLLLAVDALSDSGRVDYFPSYEIMMDELRDYRFYDEDMSHPSSQAVDYIWERFCDFALPESERHILLEKTKAYNRSRHRPLH